jgi:hypothetical protein
MAHLRRDVDNRTRQFRRDQPQRHRVRHEEGGADIERENRVEILDGDVRQISRAVHAGIVDEDLKRRRLRDRLSHGADVGDIEHQCLGLLAARADCRGGILDLGSGARRQRHVRAGRGQRRSCREPDAAPAAGDQRALSVEAERWSFSEID